MLEGIYFVLNLVIIVLVAWYFLCIFTTINNYNEIIRIKRRILLSSILFVLYIPKAIIASILGQSKTLSIVCTIIWALATIVGFFVLKQAKENALNVQSADGDGIDLDYEELENDETEKDEP